MQKRILFGLIWALGSIMQLTAQTPSIGMDTSVIYVPVTTFNTVDTFSCSVINKGAQPYTGMIHVIYAVDSSGTGNMLGLVQLADDSISVTGFQPGAAAQINEGIQITPTNFRHGINTVVIWPRAEGAGAAAFTTSDSLKLTVMVDTGSNFLHEMTIHVNPRIFPNPASQVIHIVLAKRDLGVERVRIWSLEGQVIAEEKFSGKIDVSPLAAGVYYLELVDTGGRNLRYKIIKE